MGDFIFIINKLFKIHNNAIKKHLKENNLSHYLIQYDLMEYNFKDVYQSFNVSYFTKENKLLSNWFDLDELKDYESVEYDRIILIKKFKLRVSIKNKDFSDEIIICDDYEFDLNNLNDTDSLIKIAMVKDNLDNWICSKKFDDYDYIFTSKEEYAEDLKNVVLNVFIVKGESIFLQLKNILNLLYMHKQDKFYHFINNNFPSVFPKMRNYFKILNSEFFVDEWYKNVYNIPDNTDPVIHYLLIGYKKGFNPGPNFDSWDYYELNKDIEQLGLNPLVHYEQFGKRENRKYRLSDDEIRDKLSFISNSPYFDEEWYSETYNISKELNLAKHYSNIGYKNGYNPGPNFDNDEYYKCNKDVKWAKVNPLLHYEQYGRDECRIIHVSDIPNRNHYLIEHSSFFDKQWYESTYDIPEDKDSADHYLYIGFKEDFNPGPNFNSLQYYEKHADAKVMDMNPLLHYELYVRYEGQ